MMIKVKVRWTPGHKGISENKQADVEVKRAAWGESSQQHWLPLACRGIILASRSAAQQGYMKGAKDEARKLFSGSPRCQKIQSIDLSTPSSKFRKIMQLLPWHQAALLVQLRTGHVPLHKHLHRIGKFRSATCPACISEVDSVHHYLLMCLAYAGQRRQMERALQWPARSIRMLLSNLKAFPHLFKYINDTHQFQTTFGDLQSE